MGPPLLVAPTSPAALPAERPLVRLSVRRGDPIGLIFAAIGVLGALAVKLLGLYRLPITLCYFKGFTGIPCFTCGSTRAAAHLAVLDFTGAFAVNPLATGVALALAVWGLAELLLLPWKLALRLELAPVLHPWLRWTLVVLGVANWLYLIATGA
ncbi:MAG: DUF2752 domain-containing protein [Vicinamibacteria bacterium]